MLQLFEPKSLRAADAAGTAPGQARSSGPPPQRDHRRLRRALYVVLLVIGLHAAVQMAHTQRLEHVRVAADAAVKEAAAQRSLSERIASLAAAPQAHELRSALKRSDAAAAQLERLLLAQGVDEPRRDAVVGAAWAAWQSSREALVAQSQQLLATGDPAGRAALAAEVQARAAAAIAATQRLADGLNELARARHRTALQDARLWSLLTLALLVALAGFVAEPAVRAVRRQAQRLARQTAELQRTQADLRIAATALDSAEAITITDAAGAILKVNSAFTRITGYTADEALGRSPGRLLKSGRHDAGFYAAMWQSLGSDGHWQGEVWNRRKSGDIYPQWLSITVVKDDAGRTTNYVAVFNDISQRKKDEQLIHSLAFYDPLTELPNRRLLRERLQDVIDASARNAHHVALLFIDLDHFKELNDTKGHDVGDLLLVEVARRLAGGVRGTDTVARQGGDEFVVVCPGLSAAQARALEQAGDIAETLRLALNLPYALPGGEYRSTPSIGISLFCGAEHGADELLRRADVALYEAKRAGRNRTRVFDPVTQAALQRRTQLESDLRLAVPQEQLVLHFQPQVDANDAVIGAEALLRWQRPGHGLVAPVEFIPVAEDSDLILEIGRWVLGEAARQLRRWADDPALACLGAGVNVSARQFRQDDFVEQVRSVVEEHGIAPGRLTIELTESLVLADVDDAMRKMAALRACGVVFAADDFGTGQSSLAYLTRLPFEELKIDRSFVMNMAGKRSDAVVVQTIIGMARSLGMQTIAEGVERADQRDLLARLGCRRFQGFLYGAPVPLAEFEALVRRLRRASAAA